MPHFSAKEIDLIGDRHPGQLTGDFKHLCRSSDAALAAQRPAQLFTDFSARGNLALQDEEAARRLCSSTYGLTTSNLAPPVEAAN
jgi:hypothetical protein